MMKRKNNETRPRTSAGKNSYMLTGTRGKKERSHEHGNKRDTLGRRRSRISDGFRKQITARMHCGFGRTRKKQRKSPGLNREIPEKKKTKIRNSS